MPTNRDDTSSSTALSDLKALNARFIHNFVTNDVPSHDAMLHMGFTAIQSNGARIDRDTYLQRWKTGFSPEIIPYWDVRDESITIIGDVALVRATNKHVVRRNGTETSGMTTYTDTYVRTGDAWKCIQAQLTPVQSGYEPSDDTIISVYLNGVKQNPV